MTSQVSAHHGDFKRQFQSWGFSIALHLTAVGAAGTLMTGLQPPPLPEPFQWNVSLVQPPSEPVHQARSDASQEIMHQTGAAAPVQESVETQETRSAEREQVPPIESPALVPSPMPRAVARPLPAPVLPEPSPVPEHQPVEKTPAVATAHQDTPSSDTPVSVRESLQASVQPERPLPPQAQEAPAPPVSPEPALKQQAPASPAPASPSQATQKRDYGWLAEALWKRIEQLKQYPVAARLNRWEGKVVLRAVIKDDGNLADLKVAQSSGYEVLDQDALKILRQTVPLKLSQPLGRPQIVIHVPISYQLK